MYKYKDFIADVWFLNVSMSNKEYTWNKWGKKIESLSKEIGDIKNQRKIVELKNTIIELKSQWMGSKS